MEPETLIDVAWPFFAGEFSVREIKYDHPGKKLFTIRTGWDAGNSGVAALSFADVMAIPEGKTLRIKVSIVDDYSE